MILLTYLVRYLFYLQCPTVTVTKYPSISVMVQQSVSWSSNQCHGPSIGVMVTQSVSWSIN